MKAFHVNAMRTLVAYLIYFPTTATCWFCLGIVCCLLAL